MNHHKQGKLFGLVADVKSLKPRRKSRSPKHPSRRGLQSQTKSVAETSFDHGGPISLNLNLNYYGQASSMPLDTIKALQQTIETPIIAQAYGQNQPVVESFEDEDATTLAKPLTQAQSSPSNTIEASNPALDFNAAFSEDEFSSPSSLNSDDDFAKDLQAILGGQMLFDETNKTLVERNEASLSKEKSKQEKVEDNSQAPADPHSLFDKIAQNMAYANTFNLGTVDLSSQLDAFDAIIDAKKQSQQVYNNQKLPGTKEPIPHITPLSLSDLDMVEDLSFIDDQNVQSPPPNIVEAQSNVPQTIEPESEPSQDV